MSTRVFESAGQRIDLNGNVREVELNGAVKDKLLNDAKTGAYAGDVSDMLYEKSGLSAAMEQVFDSGKLNSASTAADILDQIRWQQLQDETLSGIEGYSDITVTYKDDHTFSWNDGEGTNVPLTAELLEKIDSGAISDATISMGLNQIEIKDGEVTKIWDGWEDQIPQSIMDDAAEFGQDKGVAVTVVPFGKIDTQDPEVQYMYVDDEGGIIGMTKTDGPDGGVVHVDPNAPTHNPTGGGTPDKVIGNNEKAPHVDNKVEVEQQKPEINLTDNFEPSAQGLPDAEKDPEIEIEPFQLSYEPGTKIEESKDTIELQEKMLKLAELDPTLKIDVGSKDGKADGLYGPKTRESVMEVEKHLGLDAETGITGVADNNLMASIDNKIAELELAAAPKVEQEQDVEPKVQAVVDDFIINA